jgi:hypothetical protein
MLLPKKDPLLRNNRHFSICSKNSKPHCLAGLVMTAKRAGPGVNVTFLENSRKKFTRFCRNFKNVAGRAEVFGGLGFFAFFLVMKKSKKRIFLELLPSSGCKRKVRITF